MATIIIVLGIVALINLGVFATGTVINSIKFEQIIPEKKVMFPCLVLFWVSAIALMVITVMEVF